MAWYSDFSFILHNYKCFGSAGAEFGDFQLVNILIGKNNTGKSTIVDFVEGLCLNKYRRELAGNASELPWFEFKAKLSETLLRRSFLQNTSGGLIPGPNHWEYGKLWINKAFTIKVKGDQDELWRTPIFVEHESLGHARYPELRDILNSDSVAGLVQHLRNPFTGKTIVKIAAERQVVPEKDGLAESVHPDGTGITSLLQNYCNYNNRDSSLVESVMLEGLNAVFAGEAAFDRISLQRRESDNMWEIYLHEAGKGRIPLSESGSGLQTVIFVLACLHVIPHFKKTNPGEIVYAFEELENNLHPSVIRRLMGYVYLFCERNAALCFVTTHSPVCIDYFGRQEKTTIIHVQGRQGSTQTSAITTHSEYGKVLDDIDAKASDLLQANGVIWVEGPSDRVLITKWLSLASGGRLHEGLHYVCAFYGGKLLARLTATAAGITAEAVPLIFMNRNMAIVMDSDRKSLTQFRYAKTKHRIMDEVTASGGFGWVTQGKEIENYISPRIVSVIRGLRYAGQAAPVGITDDLYKVILPVSEDYRKIVERVDKIALAQRVADLTQESDLDVLDLRAQIEGLCRYIKKWNSIK